MAHPLTHIAAPARESAPLAAARSRRLLAGTAAAVLLTAAGAAHGSYFAGSWGWLTVACAWAALLALVADADVALPRLGGWTLAAWAAVAAWTLVTVAWSVDVTQTVLEVQRTLVYVAAFAAAVLLARRTPAALIAGTLAAIAALCTYALATRLVPDRFGVVDAISGYRLSEPIGYWNALALVAGMGALLGLGLAARSATATGRMLAAAPLPLLFTALYFTFSRGGWAATIGGVLLALLVDRRRLQLLATAAVLAPWSALAVYLASDSHALTTTGTPLVQQAHQGHRLLLPLLGLAVASALAAGGLALLEPQVAIPTRPAEAMLVAAIAAAALVGFATYGSPWHLADRAWHSFESQPLTTGPNLNSRLFHLSSSGRVAQWKVAWKEATLHPVLGSGAGTYELYWDRYRTTGGKVRDVHNRYLETLAEQGPIGLALLVLAFGLPLVALFRRRDEPLAAAIGGAAFAYLLHSAVDWDWEIASVTLIFVACSAALVAGDPRPLVLGRRARVAGAVLAAAAGGAGLFAIAMQTTLSRIDGSPAHAAREAARAADIQPWSTEPWRRLAAVDASARRFGAAQTALRRALAKDPGDWSLWFALAQDSDGRQRAQAMSRVAKLNPLSPELAQFRQTLVSLSGIEGAK
ncbi:MAG TPA: O-antigen ligase family protein [Gaiellaceae bacterium]|nr:O-antigen ligase family protein [Gaiellaceae bacterium]